MRKCVKELLIFGIWWLLMISARGFGQTAVYTYTGNPFTSALCCGVTTNNFISGSVTFPTPLGANLTSSDVSSLATAFSFTDSVQTADNTTTTLHFVVSTDSNGQITAWDFEAYSTTTGVAQFQTTDGLFTCRPNGCSTGNGEAVTIANVQAVAGNTTPGKWVGSSGQGRYLFNQMSGSNAPWPFQPPSVGNGAPYDSRSIVQGDFNGDGRMDFAILEDLSSNGSNCAGVAVYIAQADGTYVNTSRYLEPGSSLTSCPYGGYGISSLGLGDFNGDGKLDLVYGVTGSPDALAVQFGNGDGTFQAPVLTSILEVTPFSISVADFNGDGKLDVADTDVSNPGTFFVHMGNGDGTFQPAVPFLVSGNIGQVTAGKLRTSVNVPDIVVGTTTGTYILLNNGDGTFPAAPVELQALQGWSVTIADMNLDGNPDIVTDFGAGIYVFMGHGDGTFDNAIYTVVSTSLVAENIGGPLAVADFNGDGIPDIATGGAWTGVIVLFGNKDGTFQTPWAAYGSAATYSSIVAGDYTGDGKPDIATVPYYFTGQVFTILANNGDGTFGAGENITLPPGSVTSLPDANAVVSSDLDGDGILDLAVGTSKGVTIYLGKGDGTFKAPSPYGSYCCASATAIAAADFNHDGITDLAVVGYAGTLTIFQGTGNGSFSQLAAYTVGNYPDAIAWGDFNGDGNIDLLIGNGGDDTLSILLGNPNGTFQPATTIHSNAVPSAVGIPLPYNSSSKGVSSVGVYDFNRDGKADLLVSTGSAFAVLLGNGDGTFLTTQVTVMTIAEPLWDPFGVSAASLRNNGILDIVAPAGVGIWTFPGNDDGTFGAPVYSYGNMAGPMVVEDFNGDGIPDVAVCGPNAGVGVSLGIGDGRFRSQLQYAVPRNGANVNCVGLTAGDFNGDGQPDIAALTDDSSLTLLLSNPTLFYSSSNIAFGRLNVGTTSPAGSVTITNQSVSKLNISGISVTGTDAGDFTQTNTCGTSLASGASCTIAVTFAPTASGARNAAVIITDNSGTGSQSVQLTGTGNQVTQIAPTITWSAPAAITYGTSLSAAQLNATANVPGTFTYTPGLGAVLSVGTQTLSVSFTPTNTTNYTSASATTSVLVSPAALTVTANNASMTYGGTLPALNATISGFVNGDTQSSATTGSPALSTTAASASPAGVYPITVTQGTLSAANYSFTFVSGTLTISGEASQTITFGALANVTYGVSPITLGATASSGLPVSYAVTGPGAVAGSTLTVTGAGNVTVTASQAGNSNYAAATSVSQTFTVGKAALAIIAPSTTVIYGAPAMSVTPAYGGFVNGDTAASLTTQPTCTTTYTPKSAAGSVQTTSCSGAAAGNYTIGYMNGTVTVAKATLTVTPQNVTKVYGAPVPALPFTITGFVNGETSAVVSGAPVLSTTATASSQAATQYPISVSAGSLSAANYNFVPAPVNGTLSVIQASSTLALASNANPSATGQAVAFTATVIPQAGGTASGAVSFFDGTTNIATMTVAGNVTAYTITYPVAGSHTITATYSGDANVLGSTSTALIETVTAASNATTTTLASSVNPAYVTEPVTYTAMVSSTGGVPGGSVTFRQGAAAVATVPLAGGVASYTATYATAGTRSITAVYAGSGAFTASTSAVLSEVVRNLPAATTTVVTSSGSPTNFGQAVVFAATVTSTFGQIPKGETVIFSDGGGAVIGTAPLTAGIATITVSSLTPGAHPIRAAYAGDATYAASTSQAITQTINRDVTTVAVSSTLNPSAYGQAVSFAALVTTTGSTTPTGTVTFKNGSTNLATVALMNGAAVLTRSNLAGGSHTITVVYNGDTVNAPSTSAALVQQVNPSTTTTAVRSSVNPSRVGLPVRFTAAITSATGRVPTGTVTFVAGSTTLGTATLAGGSASIVTSALPSGTTTITATYNGNANMIASSASVAQVVQ